LITWSIAVELWVVFLGLDVHRLDVFFVGAIQECRYILDIGVGIERPTTYIITGLYVFWLTYHVYNCEHFSLISPVKSVEGCAFQRGVVTNTRDRPSYFSNYFSFDSDSRTATAVQITFFKAVYF